MLHPTADIQSKSIGVRTSIWQFCVVLEGAIIGYDCNICAGVFIENDVLIGSRVTIKNGVQIWDGVTLEDDVFIGPNVTFTNDLFPRSKQHDVPLRSTLIKRGASIGANATLLAGITIGEDSMIGAGSVVTKDVPKNAIVRGSPASIVRYVDEA